MMSWLTLVTRSNESVKFIYMGFRSRTCGHPQWWRANKAHGLHLATAPLKSMPFTSIFNTRKKFNHQFHNINTSFMPTLIYTIQYVCIYGRVCRIQRELDSLPARTHSLKETLPFQASLFLNGKRDLEFGKQSLLSLTYHRLTKSPKKILDPWWIIELMP